MKKLIKILFVSLLALTSFSESATDISKYLIGLFNGSNDLTVRLVKWDKSGKYLLKSQEFSETAGNVPTPIEPTALPVTLEIPSNRVGEENITYEIRIEETGPCNKIAGYSQVKASVYKKYNDMTDSKPQYVQGADQFTCVPNAVPVKQQIQGREKYFNNDLRTKTFIPGQETIDYNWGSVILAIKKAEDVPQEDVQKLKEDLKLKEASSPQEQSNGMTPAQPTNTPGSKPQQELTKPTNVNDLPFIYGVSSWTSTKYPWSKKTISEVQAIQGTPEDAKFKFQQPLSVLQGFDALEGGILPRVGFSHVAHIFNNTPFDIKFQSDMRDSWPYGYTGFTQIIPAHNAVPWVTTWIPQIGKNKLNNPQKSNLSFRVFQKETQGSPIIDPFKFLAMSGSGLVEETLQTTKSQLASMANSAIVASSVIPSRVTDILGTKNVTKLLFDSDAKYYLGKTYYQLSMEQETGTINLQACDFDNNKCELITSVKNPNIVGTPSFNLFNIILDYAETADSDNAANTDSTVKFHIEPAIPDSVLEVSKTKET